MSILPLFAEGVSRTTFEWGRIQSNSDWILPVGVCVAIMLFVRYMYRRDAVELPLLVGWILTALRTAAFLGLLIMYLAAALAFGKRGGAQLQGDLACRYQFEHGTERRRIAAGQNTGWQSQRHCTAKAWTCTSALPAGCIGWQSMLKETDFLAQLRKNHDVSVFQFNDDLKADRAVTLNKP